MPQAAPRSSTFSVTLKLSHSGGFGRVILIQHQKAIVDDSTWPLLQLPVISSLQVSVKPRHNLFKRLLDRGTCPRNDRRMSLRHSFTEKHDAVVAPNEIERLFKELRAFQSTEVNERFRSRVFLDPCVSRRTARFRSDTGLSDLNNTLPTLRPRHFYKSSDFFLLINSACKLRCMQLEILTRLAKTFLEAIQAFLEREPCSFMDAEPQ